LLGRQSFPNIIQTNAGKAIVRGQARFFRADRLLKHSEFQRVKLSGKNRHTAHFIVSMAENNLERPRLGVITTKRLGKAVRRNRVKRLLREFFRRHKGVLPPQDIVIIAKKGAVSLNYAEVAVELGRVFSLSEKRDGACG
jgi:ribonuclease P protein component